MSEPAYLRCMQTLSNRVYAGSLMVSTLLIRKQGAFFLEKRRGNGHEMGFTDNISA